MLRKKLTLVIQYIERNGHMSDELFRADLGGDDAETMDNFTERNPNDSAGIWP